jgi:hypothetical protein
VADRNTLFCLEWLKANNYFVLSLFFLVDGKIVFVVNSNQILKNQINSNKRTFNYKVSLLLKMNNFY